MKVALALFVATVLLVSFEAQSATLVAEYRFDNALNLGLDSSGFGNHATNSSVVQGLDRFGNSSAGSFNGTSSSLVKLGGLAGFTGLPGFTYTAWVNRSTLDTGFGGIISQDPAGPACCINRFLIDVGDTVYVDAGAHVDFDSSSPVLPNDRWIHLAMTANDVGAGNTVKIYLNGVLAFSHVFGHDLVNSSLFDTFIGTGENGNTHLFRGLFDDVRIYEGVLDDDEVYDVFDPKIIIPEPTTVLLFVFGAGLLTSRRFQTREHRSRVFS